MCYLCMNACFLLAIQVEDDVELTLHLHSNLQIKAKNYDKVEKVSVHHSLWSWLDLNDLECLAERF